MKGRRTGRCAELRFRQANEGRQWGAEVWEGGAEGVLTSTELWRADDDGRMSRRHNLAWQAMATRCLCRRQA